MSISEQDQVHLKLRIRLIEENLKFQDDVCDILAKYRGLIIQNFGSRERQYETGENRQGVEIKHDMKFRSTPNLFIETHERAMPSNNWSPSGIYRADNQWLFIIGDIDTLWLLGSVILRGMERKCSSEGQPLYRHIPTTDTDTAKGFLLPQKEADKYALWKFDRATAIPI